MDDTSPRVFPSMKSVKTFGVRKRDSTPKLLFGEKRPDVFQRCPQMKRVDRRQADKVEVCFRASKADKKIIGAVVTRTRVWETKKGRRGMWGH